MSRNCSHNDDGTLDEMWVEGAVNVHVEQMDDNVWWVGINTPQGMVHVDFWTPRARIRAAIRDERTNINCGEFGTNRVLNHEE